MTVLASWPWLPSMILLGLSAPILCLLFLRAAHWIGCLVALGNLVAAAGLAWKVSDQGVQVHQVGGWGAPLGIVLQADGLSALMLVITAVVGFMTSLYATVYFRKEAADEEASKKRAYFWPLWTFLFAALAALFLSRDLFNLYVTLELLGLSAVGLVTLAGEPEALRAAIRYLLVSMAGSLCYLFGVALIYASTGILDLSLLSQASLSSPVIPFAASLMTVGLLMKTALFPLHFWLPSAHASAPAPVSAVLSGLVVKASFYLLVRLWFEVFPGLATPAILQLLGVLGAFAILWGAFQAMQQPRLKLLVAYSTVAQLGYLFLLFPLSGPGEAGVMAWNGAFYFVIAHACAKAGMFLAAGNILHALGHDRIAEMGEITRYLPVSAFAFGLAGVSLVGLPPSGGFIAKWLLINAALGEGQWWWVVIIAGGSLLAAGYLLKVAPNIFLSWPDMPEPHPLPRLTEWAALSLALAALGLGFMALYPIGLLQVGAPFAGPLLSGGVP